MKNEMKERMNNVTHGSRLRRTRQDSRFGYRTGTIWECIVFPICTQIHWLNTRSLRAEKN